MSSSNSSKINDNMRIIIKKNIDNNPYSAIRQIILAIFYYNDEENFNEKINNFEIEFNKLDLKEYLNIDFLEIKNLLNLINSIDKNNFNNYYKLYEYKNDIKNNDLLSAFLYFILELLSQNESWLYKDKKFTLLLIEEIEKNKKTKNEQLKELFVYLF